MYSIQLTGKCFVCAASNSNKILDDVLTVGRLPTTTLSQQDNGLIQASGQEVPVSSLGHAINVRGRVFPSAAFEHLHYLGKNTVKYKDTGRWWLYISNMSYCAVQIRMAHMLRLQQTFSEYIEGALMGLMTTMFGPAWVCTRLPPYRCRRECITLDSFKYCREARSSSRSNIGGFA